jgi:hypothetical protein
MKKVRWIRVNLNRTSSPLGILPDWNHAHVEKCGYDGSIGPTGQSTLAIFLQSSICIESRRGKHYFSLNCSDRADFEGSAATD